MWKILRLPDWIWIQDLKSTNISIHDHKWSILFWQAGTWQTGHIADPSVCAMLTNIYCNLVWRTCWKLQKHCRLHLFPFIQIISNWLYVLRDTFNFSQSFRLHCLRPTVKILWNYVLKQYKYDHIPLGYDFGLGWIHECHCTK